jgi:hypothetical protein
MRYYHADFVKFHENVSVCILCTDKTNNFFERVEQ